MIALHTDRFWDDVVFRRTGVHSTIPSLGGTVHIAHLGAAIHGTISRYPRIAGAVVCSLPVVPWGPNGFGHLGDQFSLASAMPIVAGLFWALGAIVTRDYCSQETPSAMLAALFSMQFVWRVWPLSRLPF